MSETRKLFESFQKNLNESKGRKLSFKESALKEEKTVKEFRIIDTKNNKVLKVFKAKDESKGYDEMRKMGEKLKAEGKEDNLIYKEYRVKSLTEDDSFYNELEVTNYRPTGQNEGALANMKIKSKFGELEVNLLNIDGEYRLVTPNMWRTKEEEELINNLVNEYGMQGLTDFAADYHYKQTHMNESTLNEDKPDFMVFTNDKLTDYDSNIKKLNSRIRRMKALSKHHPEYKEQVDKLRKELKQTKQDRESYINSEEFKDEKEKYFNSTNESTLNEDGENNNIKIIDISVSDEHKPNRDYEVIRDKTPLDIVFYGYATIYTDKLGEFTVSFDTNKYIPRTDGFPWEFLQKEKLTDEQIDFINSHKTKISNLIYKSK